MPPLTFLDLPGEIRNQIYHYLLLIPTPSTRRTLGSDPPIHASILLTNKTIHHETQQILYSKNTFLAHPNLLSSLPRLRPYYASISSANLISLIRRFHFRVRLDNDPNFTREQATRAFSGVEELTVEVFQAQYGSSGFEVLRLLEGVRAVERVRVYGSVIAFPEYVAWLTKSMMAGVEDVGRFGEGGKEEGRGGMESFDLWTVSAALSSDTES